MTIFYKYKIYSKPLLFLNAFPKIKLLNFKRSKWKKFIQIFSKSKKKKLDFFNFSKNYYRINFWDKIQKTYKNGLLLKKSLENYYNNSLSLKFLKDLQRNKKKFFILSKYLVMPLMKLDVFLWKLRLFTSVRQIRQYIISKNVILNEKILKKNTFLKEGDIIKIPTLMVLKNPPKYSFNFLSSFCELDYYTNTFVIFKSLKHFNLKDFNFLFQHNKINLKVLEFYLNKK